MNMQTNPCLVELPRTARCPECGFIGEFGQHKIVNSLSRWGESTLIRYIPRASGKSVKYHLRYIDNRLHMDNRLIKMIYLIKMNVYEDLLAHPKVRGVTASSTLQYPSHVLLRAIYSDMYKIVARDRGNARFQKLLQEAWNYAMPPAPNWCRTLLSLKTCGEVPLTWATRTTRGCRPSGNSPQDHGRTSCQATVAVFKPWNCTGQQQRISSH